MCPRDQYRFAFHHMDNILFQNVIDQGVGLGMISLDMCGFGDSFMDPDFKAKLTYVKEKYPFVKVYTSTTGHLLYSKDMDWVCELIDTLRISNYGFSNSVYENVHRGALKYDKIKQNLDALLALEKDKRPFVAMQFLVLAENEHQVDEWKTYWEPKVDEVMIWLPHNYGGSRFSEQLKMLRSQEDILPSSCGRPFKGNLFIRENGEVSMCCFDFNHQLIIGDINRQRLKDILLGEPLQKIREIHSSGNFESCDLMCRNCDQIYPRNGALIYSTNPSRKVGVLNTHPNFIRDMLSDGI